MSDFELITIVLGIMSLTIKLLIEYIKKIIATVLINK